MSDATGKSVGQTILSSTVVSRDGAKVKVTRLNLTDTGKEMLRSNSSGIFTQSEKSYQTEQTGKKLAAA